MHIQKIGAKLAIIIDIEENEENVIMVDINREGDQVYIPTYMIDHKEGTAIWDAVKNGTDVVIKSSLEMMNFFNATGKLPY
jgi:hypothetical protein